MTGEQPIWNFEQEPYPEGSDETEVNLRAYLDRMSDDKMRTYQATFTDHQLIDWDGNFKSDGTLMLICSERDVEVEDYRRALEDCIRYRNRARK